MKLINALLTLGFLLSLNNVSAQVQDTLKKTPIVKFYSIDGKLVPNDKINDLMKSMGGIVSFDEKKYGTDSIVIRLVKVSEEKLRKHNEEQAQRLVATRAMIGKLINDFKVIDTKGRKYQLSKLRGKVVVLNFWFTGCPPCIEEIPQLKRVAHKYTNSDVKFLAITYETVDQVSSFLTKHDFGFSVAANAKDVVENFHIGAFPTTLVIDKKGILKFHISDNKDLEHLLIKEIDDALAK
jgi:peroxiredoxin